MVRIHLKKGEHEFLYETTLSTEMSEIITHLVDTLSMLLRIRRLISYTEDLLQHGPLREPNQQGLDEYLPEEQVQTVKDSCVPGQHIYRADPTGRRCGKAPDEPASQVLQRTLDETKELIQKERLATQPLELTTLHEAMDNIRGAVMIAYPMGLPEFDPSQEIFEGKEDEAACQHAKDILDPGTAKLWFSNRVLERGKTLGQHVRTTERSKIICKLAKPDAGPPVRESAVSEQEQREMMAYWYRKQEEAKKLAEDDDDAYTNSPWANPNQLRAGVTGLGNIRWR
eukprot:gnl/Trimastix_PCT/2525.p2 GENE.gnl/Trimastix_PCT/2525~~gnl/Trimastix_PCT/2525.p2  ORF type:complete len:284 (+),score=78.97 gnl/Trimastix_PCT/2525:81-932(+)